MASAKPILPQHQEFLDEHFGGLGSQWNSFHRKLRGKQFVDAVRGDTRSDSKLKRFARMVGYRQQSKQPGMPAVGDSGKTYKIKYHPEAKRFSCSCKDWTYKRSVKNRGRTGDCKHINRMKSSMKQKMSKTASLALLRLAGGFHKEEKNRDEALRQKIKHKAYKKNLPSRNVLRDFLLKSASVRGRAAGAFLTGMRGN